MNYIDIIFIIPVLWFGFRGYKNGVIKEAASLLALVLGIYGAIKLSGFTSKTISDATNWNPDYLPVIAFAFIFILIVIIVHFIAKLADKLAKAVALGLVVRILGLLFGAMKIILIMSVLLSIIDKLDQKSNILPKDMKEGSLFYNPVREISVSIFPLVESFDLNDVPSVDEAVEVLK